ncbi:hypothetical protein BGZ93_000198, partial [Podila epicladia]
YFNYGCHASLSELEDLVRVVAPRALFPCVLHKNIGLQTYADSNSKAVALLAHAIPNEALITHQTEEQRIDAQYGITRDFQEYHRVNGFNVLDASDKIRVVEFAVPATPRATGQKQPQQILSPRSNHLRKKLDRLRRQLRNSESLNEGAETSDSSIDEGPLSLDLNDLERKRKWWLETERGKSTTFEDTSDDWSFVESEHSLGISNRSTFDVGSISNKDTTSVVGSITKKVQGQGTEEDQYDESTLELVNSWELPLPPDCDIQSASKPSSSPEITSGYDTLSHPSLLSGDVISLEPCPVSPQKIGQQIIPIPTESVPGSKPMLTDLHSITTTSESDVLSLDPISDATTSHHSRTPLRISSHRSRTPPPKSSLCIRLGKSPTSVRHTKMTPIELSLVQRPAQNIFAQLAWSPPLKPLALKRSLTDDHSRRREQPPPRRTQSSTALMTTEVIVIESSDEEEGRTGTKENANKNRKDEMVPILHRKRRLASHPSSSSLPPLPSTSTAKTKTPTTFISGEATSVADQGHNAIAANPPPIVTMRGSQDTFWLEVPFAFE